MDDVVHLRPSDEIYAHALWTIQSLHTRPGVFIGPGDRLADADSLDAFFWLAYHFWAMIKDRGMELAEAIAAEEERRSYTKIGFPESFRQRHGESSPKETVQHVRECWASIGSRLGVDVNSAPDDSLYQTQIGADNFYMVSQVNRAHPKR